MPFKRYPDPSRLADLSASDLNARADALEKASSILGVMPKPGMMAMIGLGGAMGVVPQIQGVFIGVLTSAPAALGGALAGDCPYQADSLDGSIRITEDQTPLFRQFHESTRINPAPNGSICLIGWYPDPDTDEWTARILWVQETNNPGDCG